MTTSLIKGYHPLHMIFPSSLENLSSSNLSEDEQEDETSNPIDVNKDTSTKIHTFMYFKPHQVSHSAVQTSSSHTASQENNDDNSILFVANVPMIQGIQSSLLLEYIFGKWATVDHVVIVPSPRRHRSDGGGLEIFVDEENKKSFVDIQGDFYHPGKFAHVYFQSSKERKRALQYVTRLPKGLLHLDSDSTILDLKELVNVSLKQYQQFISQYSSCTDSNTMSLTGDTTTTHATITQKYKYMKLQDEDYSVEEEKKGIHALVRWYQRAIPCRTLLQEKCDKIICAYEEKELHLQQSQQEEKSGVPDDDGFITVSYKSMASSLMGTQASILKDTPTDSMDMMMTKTLRSSSSSSNPHPTTMIHRRRGTSSRGAPKKDRKIVRGSDQLQDFYRFQTRESRKRSADELKNKFQQDLQRVKKMKEDKEYRPF